MSSQPARARILRYAEENQPFLDPACDPETGFFVDDPEAHMSGLLDAYAHELAEQQRASAKGWGMALDNDPYVGVGDVIDLIDPNVSSEEPTA